MVIGRCSALLCMVLLALLLLAGCQKSEPPSAFVWKGWGPVSEPIDQAWVLSSDWQGFMGIAIGLTSNKYYYWFLSDVGGGDEPAYPITGDFTFDGNTLTLDSPDVDLYAHTWLVVTNADRTCFWAERDVGDFSRLLIPDSNFNPMEPFENQETLRPDTLPPGISSD